MEIVCVAGATGKAGYAYPLHDHVATSPIFNDLFI